ncbi:rho guanine nucleotide exchange factor 17 [Anopheles funestus]|uniref:rho guanine nucleotide exchange factor 17 n=1 Tax=Anopheles funestus TaxID=62324 RepID=UPI0020C731D1|nr:rho guanine nucleotide exchange factor 17 [Anopheles funestus]
MEKLQKHSSVPNIFARFFKSFTPRTVNYQNGTLYSRSATSLKQHNLERVELRQVLNSLPERQQKRWMSFQQFIMHEQNYLDAMRKLQYEIYDELLQKESIIDWDLSYTIFGTHTRICMLHQFIQPLLAACVNEWPDRYLAGWMICALLEQPSLTQLYSVFIKNYRLIVALVTDQMNTNDIFSWFIQSKLRDFGGKLSFSDYFIMPVQRIPQVGLEVKELLKYTPETDPDWALMDRCVKRATLLGEQLNASSGKHEIVQTVLNAIENAAGDRSRTYLHGRYQCELLHSEQLTEVFRNHTGSRFVLLLSDRLVCAKLPEKKHKHGPIGVLKWVIPLQDIVIDGDELDATTMSSSMANDVSSNSFKLMSDFGTLSDIRDLVSTFQEPHVNLSVDACRAELDNIWHSVLQQNANQDDPCLLRVKSKHGKTHTLKMNNADTKIECNAIRLGQLALRPENSPAWWNSTVYAPYEPLFVKTFQAGHQDAMVTGGCSYVPNTNSRAYSNDLFRAWSKQQHVLWISSIDKKHNSTVSLYTHDRIKHVIAERASFTLPASKIVFIAYVPEGMVGNTPTDTVWIATRSRILIYSATFPMISDRLECFRIRDTPNRILYHAKRVFVSTDTNKLLIFSMTDNGVWDLKTPQLWQNGSVHAMAIGISNVYMAVNNNIHIFDSETGKFINQISSPPTSPEDRRCINFLQYSVHGLWVARERSGIVSLYHAEYYQHLLDIDTNKHINRFLSENAEDPLNKRTTVKSIIVIDNMLWIGTSAGIVLSLHLPNCANVPIMTDQISISYHGHIRNVSIIMPLPSLSVRKKNHESIDIEPAIVESLFQNTRKPSRDLCATSVGVDDESFTFIDSFDDFDEPDSIYSNLDELNVSKEYTAVEKKESDVEEKFKTEYKTENRTPWTPDSILIVTGGYDYIKRSNKTSQNTSLHESFRSLSVANIAESSSNLNTTPINKNGNIMLWEKQSQ